MDHHRRTVLSNIQMLRGVAATLVIFVHLNSMLAAIGVPRFGGGGIDLFFVISGYIMVHTTRDQAISPGTFIRNRIIRVVPIYWLLTLAVFSLSGIAPYLLQTTKPQPIFLLKSLLFIPFYKSPGNLEPLLFVGWTLNYEIFFYLIFTLGLLFRPYILGFLSTIAILALLAVARAIAPSEDIFFQFYTSPLLLEFAFGMLIGIGAGAWRFSAAHWKYVLFGILALSITALVVVPVPGDAAWRELLGRGVPAAIAIWAALGLESRGQSVKTAALVSLGDASYSMYLTHPFVTQTFEKICARLHAGAALAVVLIAACVAAVLVTAQLFHRTIELPVTNSVRRWLQDGSAAMARRAAQPTHSC